MGEYFTQKEYMSPPRLRGYCFSSETIQAACRQKKLLSITIETNSQCNLHCSYCEGTAKNAKSYEADLSDITKVISEARALGAEAVVVGGAGEPTLYKEFIRLIEIICGYGLIPVVFTNAITLTPHMCSFLKEHNVSVMTKLDSLRPATQDHLSGVNGAYVAIQAGLHNLFNAGYTEPSDPLLLSLGISIVANLLNVEEIEELWHFCRRHNIFPNVKALKNFGSTFYTEQNHYLSPERISDLKLKLLAIDREFYNFDWIPYTPLPGCSCLQYLYSLYITMHGEVRPCRMTKFDKHPFFSVNGKYPFNAFSNSLEDIYNAEPFVFTRSIGKYLQGNCSKCKHSFNCIGCRGFAYNTGINRGLVPYEALCLDSSQCFC
ncbi:MAG: radical SAM protein [Fibrobacter sp.]|nr:radical SAM protein [Fibrobacter sp.]